MAFYDGISFFIILLLGCIPAVILGLKERPIRNYLLAFSLLIIALICGQEPIGLLYLAAYIFLEWHVIAVFQLLRKRWGKNQIVFYHAIAFALLPLVIAKCSGLIGHHWFAFIGISYITFRVLQIIIETHDGLIEKSGFKETMTFLLFFPSLSSGPIDRSRRFAEDLYTVPDRAAYMDLLQKGIFKILQGLFYKYALSAIAFSYVERLSDRYAPVYLAAYAYMYGVYMFFDFAGYSLMAVGTGYVFGVRVPDNFNKPYISIDIKEFWDRWHISLSHWFRDYVFSRFMIFAIRKKRFKNRLNAASAGFIVNMLVMGVWHGLSADYLLYGLYHGVLLALTERFQKKKWYKEHRNKTWYKALSWFVTLNLVMFGFFIFSGRMTETLSVAVHVLINGR